MGTIVDGPGFAARAADGLYTEALLLSDETRAYFDGPGRAERDGLAPAERVAFACESLKATTRLLQVMAWAAQRRHRAGDLPPVAEADGSEPAVLGALPSAARRLILAGIDLHGRAVRLGHGTDAAVASAGPARALMRRLERAF